RLAGSPRVPHRPAAAPRRERVVGVLTGSATTGYTTRTGSPGAGAGRGTARRPSARWRRTASPCVRRTSSPGTAPVFVVKAATAGTDVAGAATAGTDVAGAGAWTYAVGGGAVLLAAFATVPVALRAREGEPAGAARPSRFATPAVPRAASLPGGAPHEHRQDHAAGDGDAPRRSGITGR
ncbi:hypothetical protein ACWES4_13155, partial [Streptomyces sp. NPDC004011]